jgi:hypothetical protein
VRASAPSVLHLATELLSAHRFSAVVDLCESAIESGADDTPTRLVLTRALLAQNRDDEARSHLATCAELDPGCSETFRLLAQVARRSRDLGAATLFLRDADAIERRSTNRIQSSPPDQLATDTWDGTTMDRKLERSTDEKTVKRRAPRRPNRRARTRLERPRKLMAVGTQLNDQRGFLMENHPEVGAFPL